MATYYINPTGSNTAPFDTVAKGANTFKILTDSATLLDTDTTYVEGDNGDIVDVMHYLPPLELRGTITKNPTSTNRPTVSLFELIDMDHRISTTWSYNHLEISYIDFQLSWGFINIQDLVTDLGDFILDSCTISGGGHGVYVTEGWGTEVSINSITVKNCIFDSTGLGVGILPYYYPNTTDIVNVVNNVFYNNSSWGFIIYGFGSSLIFKNNIMHTMNWGRQIGNTSPLLGGDVDYNIGYNCIVEFKVLPQQPNEILADPLFVDPTSGDFTLDDLSPAINSGTPTSATLDFNGVARPVGAAFDMGAYESGIPVPIFDGVTTLKMIETGYLEAKWSAATGSPEYYDIYLKATDDTDLFTDTYFNHSVNSNATNSYIYQDASQVLLLDDTVYYVGVRARNGGGSDSNEVSASNPIINRINPKRYPSQGHTFG